VRRVGRLAGSRSQRVTAAEWDRENQCTNRPQRHQAAADVKLKIIQRPGRTNSISRAADQAVATCLIQVDESSQQREGVQQDIHPTRDQTGEVV